MINHEAPLGAKGLRFGKVRGLQSFRAKIARKDCAMGARFAEFLDKCGAYGRLIARCKANTKGSAVKKKKDYVETININKLHGTMM